MAQPILVTDFRFQSSLRAFLIEFYLPLSYKIVYLLRVFQKETWIQMQLIIDRS